jgi:hypothetical protein
MLALKTMGFFSLCSSNWTPCKWNAYATTTALLQDHCHCQLGRGVLCMIYNLYPRAVITWDEDKPDVFVHEEVPEFDIVAKLMEGLRIRLSLRMRTLYVHMITCTNMQILQLSNPKLTLNPKFGWSQQNVLNTHSFMVNTFLQGK